MNLITSNPPHHHKGDETNRMEGGFTSNLIIPRPLSLLITKMTEDYLSKKVSAEALSIKSMKLA